MSPSTGSFKPRLLAGSLSLLITLLLIYYSQHPAFAPFFTAFYSIGICIGLWEFYQIGKSKGFQPISMLGIIGSFAFCCSLFLSTQYPSFQVLPGIIAALILVLGLLHFLQRGQEPYANLAVTFFGFFYVTLPLSLIILINYQFKYDAMHDGRWWLFYILLVTKVTDIGCYLFGKLWGRIPLAPYISPKKTWEGALGGLIAGTGISFLYVLLSQLLLSEGYSQLSLIGSIVLGASLSIVGQLGDLAESLLKRDAGVKDSNQLPGLGGALDMLDSTIFTAPVIYFFLAVRHLS